ncbi:hypothetical protein [Natrarchaeobaculum sulfurireducens]|uniref:Site-specific DNA methylase n=1 Tax=Natrarchaeobaculum sulfurireducens TaxID=2044521 RepID=A0A346PHL3_9EURY|nr:hypothetical protein [Natrarchaeobaculum sulfurireducens]AXR79008.1 Site-specific DNA methylase [Natrarchaeobaculum sulfurireducens]AXR80804.1 hypothetical protein AArcMg_0782 [Natrarchaeobaculum sulfurireducens]
MTESIIPDDFDLEKARAKRSSTPDEKRKRCPECHNTSIIRKTSKPSTDRYEEGDWRCDICCAHFDEPLRGDPGA